MGNLIMPKQTAEFSRLKLTLDILIDCRNSGNSIVSNEIYKDELKKRLPSVFDDTSDEPMMVKQSEMARYFGLAFRDFPKRTQVITERGLSFYTAYHNQDKNTQHSLIAESILEDSFGRDNSAIKTSDSDIDPPKLFIYGILKLSGITKEELALLLYLTHDCELSEKSAIDEIVHLRLRKSTTIVISTQKQNKYRDPKFPAFLVEIDFCYLDDNQRYRLTEDIENRFSSKFELMSIYNRTPLSTRFLDIEDDTADIIETDQSATYKKQVHTTLEYDVSSIAFTEQNTRVPKLKKQSLSGRKFSTNPRIAKTALKLSKYLCEHDNKHITFLNKSDTPFMEPHHFVPMSAQGDIQENLDCVENIVSLCPNCHSAIHYGNTEVRKHIVKHLYEQREQLFVRVKVNLSVEELFEKYYP